jgi:hypothetical protein
MPASMVLQDAIDGLGSIQDGLLGTMVRYPTQAGKDTSAEVGAFRPPLRLFLRIWHRPMDVLYTGRKAVEESAGWRIPRHCKFVVPCFLCKLFVARASRPLARERPAPAARAGCPRHSGRDARATILVAAEDRAALPPAPPSARSSLGPE